MGDSWEWLNGREVVRILKECGESGVKSFKLGPLCVEFEAEQPNSAVTQPSHIQILGRSDESASNNTQDSEGGISAQEEYDAKQERLAQTLIDDPTAWQEQMIEDAEDAR